MYSFLWSSEKSQPAICFRFNKKINSNHHDIIFFPSPFLTFLIIIIYRRTTCRWCLPMGGQSRGFSWRGMGYRYRRWLGHRRRKCGVQESWVWRSSETNLVRRIRPGHWKHYHGQCWVQWKRSECLWLLIRCARWVRLPRRGCWS